jgi:hypothetical protein
MANRVLMTTVAAVLTGAVRHPAAIRAGRSRYIGVPGDRKCRMIASTAAMTSGR